MASNKSRSATTIDYREVKISRPANYGNEAIGNVGSIVCGSPRDPGGSICRTASDFFVPVIAEPEIVPVTRVNAPRSQLGCKPARVWTKVQSKSRDAVVLELPNFGQASADEHRHVLQAFATRIANGSLQLVTGDLEVRQGQRINGVRRETVENCRTTTTGVDFELDLGLCPRRPDRDRRAPSAVTEL